MVCFSRLILVALAFSLQSIEYTVDEAWAFFGAELPGQIDGLGNHNFPLLGGLGHLLRGEAQDGTVQDRLAVQWPVGAQRIEFIIQRSTAFPCPQREIDALGSVGFGGRTAFQRCGQTFGRWIAATIQDVQGLEGRPAPVFGHSHRNAPMVDKTPVTATMAS